MNVVPQYSPNNWQLGKIVVTGQNVTVIILGEVKGNNTRTKKFRNGGEVRLGEICVKSLLFIAENQMILSKKQV